MANYKSAYTGTQIDAAIAKANASASTTDLNTHSSSVTPHGGIQHRNLLHNWDFRNPVNQRGATSGTGPYFIDRWAGTINSVTSGGLSVINTNYMVQRFDDSFKNALDGKTVTGSVLYSDGTIESGSAIYHKELTGFETIFETSNVKFQIHYFNTSDRGGVALTFLSTKTVVSVKLELGTVSTLANDPPADFGEQLAICQRYYQKGRISRLNVSVDSTTTLYAMIPTPVSMRTNAPTLVSCTVHDWMRFGSTQITSYTLSSYATNTDGTQANGGIGIVLTFSTALFTLYQVGYLASISYEFSADL